jgi:3-hydroxy-9,10-secoandrosta-1,3,5(10)-triene-9,17-dione monooxygenase reductase component
MTTPGPDDQRAYRDAIGRFATGVTVVTAAGPDGPAGMTTNAVTSLSLEPRLLLVCFDAGSRTLPVVEASGRFAVNVLRAADRELATVFASKRVAREKFERVTHAERHGVPVLDDALAWIVCDVAELRPAGDHVIAIGAVLATSTGHDDDPLVFFRGAYATTRPL